MKFWILVAGLMGMTSLGADNTGLFLWSKYPERFEGISAVFNQVWAAKSETLYSGREVYRKDVWLSKGVLPLAWEGGEVYRSFSEEKLYKTWSGTLKLGHAGIHIDEMSEKYPSFIAKAASVLAEIREEFPEAVIGIWQAGPLTPELADLYKKYADFVFLEVYFRDEEFGFSRIREYASQVKNFGLEKIAVPALGVGKSKWITTADQFSAQLRALRESGLVSNGIALFAPDAKEAVLDEIIKIYKAPSPML